MTININDDLTDKFKDKRIVEGARSRQVRQRGRQNESSRSRRLPAADLRQAVDSRRGRLRGMPRIRQTDEGANALGIDQGIVTEKFTRRADEGEKSE